MNTNTLKKIKLLYMLFINLSYDLYFILSYKQLDSREDLGSSLISVPVNLNEPHTTVKTTMTMCTGALQLCFLLLFFCVTELASRAH